MIEISEAVTLNGQTAVTTTNTFKCVTKITVTSAGATGSNEGVIYARSGTVTAGVPATFYGSIEIGTNISAIAVLFVPKDHIFVVSQIFTSIGDSSKTRNFNFKQYVPATGLWLEAFDVHTKEAEFLLPVVAYPALVEGSVIDLNVAVDTGTAKVTASLAGYLIAQR